MEPEQFIELALRTESNNFPEIIYRLSNPKNIRLLHAAMGLCTEANEFLDAMKKFIFYGKPIDEINLAEELGDSDWYKALACNVLDKSFEEIWAIVINKLSHRYGIGFNNEGAINRDIDSERLNLEMDFAKTSAPAYPRHILDKMRALGDISDFQYEKMVVKTHKVKENAQDCVEVAKDIFETVHGFEIPTKIGEE